MPDFAAVDVGTLERFLATWYGPPDRPSTAPDLAGALALPGPLREWYAVTSAYRRPLTFRNTVLPPDQVYQDAGKLVFWVENQQVYLWAADPQGDDPMVHERANVEGEPWHPTEVPLSGFLLTVAVLEACMGGASYGAYADGLTQAQAAACLAAVRPLPYPGPTYQGQLYSDHQMLAFATPSSDALWQVTLAARTRAAIQRLTANTSGIGWDIAPADDHHAR